MFWFVCVGVVYLWDLQWCCVVVVCCWFLIGFYECGGWQVLQCVNFDALLFGGCCVCT